MEAEISALIENSISRLTSSPDFTVFSNEHEASQALTIASDQAHRNVEQIMQHVQNLVLDALRRRSTILHESLSEAYCAELAKVRQVKQWSEQRQNLLGRLHQASRQTDLDKKEVQKLAAEAIFLQRNIPCRMVTLNEGDTSTLSQKLVNTVMKIGQVQVGPKVEDNDSDCISIGTASLSLSQNLSNMSSAYETKNSPRSSWGVKNKPGPEADKANCPRGAAVLQNSLVFVADSYNNRIKVIDLATFQQMNNLTFAIDRAKTISNKQLTFTGLAMDAAKNRLLISDAEKGCFHVVDLSKSENKFADGNQVSDWPIVASIGSQGFQDKNFNVPYGLCYDSQSELVFICDSKNNQVKVWSLKNNEFVSAFGEIGKKIGQFMEPSYCAIFNRDSSGNLMLAVSDSMNHRIQILKVDIQPSFKITAVRCIGKEGTSLGQLINPRGLCFDQNGALLIADAGNKRLQLFSIRDGSPICLVAAKQGIIPEALAITSEMEIIVTDRKQHLVYIF